MRPGSTLPASPGNAPGHTPGPSHHPIARAALILGLLVGLGALGFIGWTTRGRPTCYPAALFPSPINQLGCVRGFIAGPTADPVRFTANGQFTVAWRLTSPSPPPTCDATIKVAVDSNAINQELIQVSQSSPSGLRTFAGSGKWYVDRPGICAAAVGLAIAVSY